MVDWLVYHPTYRVLVCTVHSFAVLKLSSHLCKERFILGPIRPRPKSRASIAGNALKCRKRNNQAAWQGRGPKFNTDSK
jgi:hypothetical protein